MSMLNNCFKAFSFVGIFSIFNMAFPAVAANYIEIPLVNQNLPVSVADLKRFAETGNKDDLSEEFYSFLNSYYNYKSDVNSYYEDRGLKFPDFLSHFQQQLNRPIPTDTNSTIDSIEQKLLQLILPYVEPSNWNVFSRIIDHRFPDKKLITFLENFPRDTITEDNFFFSFKSYNAPKPKPIDLTTWKQEGAPSSGVWAVSADGSSVIQTINGRPTFFVSPEEFINTTVTGKFRVEDRIDNDFIGFVFGYQSPIAANDDPVNDFKFLLFDWTRLGSIGEHGHEGFALTEVKGKFSDYTSGFWYHQESAEFDILTTDYSLGKGWTPYTEYDFSLQYETDRIKIHIDGVEIFDLSGDFEAGRFGFYNYSQSYVRYSGFASQPVPEPAAIGGIAMLGLIGLGKMASRKRKGA
ncbi:hypothetical protein PN466_01145 [Roseofilum reptotaenium CS-1145]|nr:hypothetical protein [Roseofilum reptotaenium]MDB9515566.1 hypothetical protein [Roseofilum reptotaenium CS-1145]